MSAGNIRTNDGFFATVKEFEDFWKQREKKAYKRSRKETVGEVLNDIEGLKSEEGTINYKELKKHLKRK